MAWNRMSQAEAQLMTWFAVGGELHRDWRNDIEGFGGSWQAICPPTPISYRAMLNRRHPDPEMPGPALQGRAFF